MRLPKMSLVVLLAAFTATTGFTHPSLSAKHPSLAWKTVDTGTQARLRGLAPVNRHVAWASGTEGTVVRTVDGGRTWQRAGPAGTGDLQFRDIEAFDADHAVALSIGEGPLSRVYVTADAGGTWAETFRNDDPRAFYDCVAFADRRHGLALSDPVDGRFRILSTMDGGRTWRVLPSTGMPAALDGEFAFAASGTCLVSAGHHGDYWFATGGGAAARVFHSRDGGATWTVATTPVPSGPTAGIYSLAFRDARTGVAVGGDFATPTVAPDAAATTGDGGARWTGATREPGEYRSGVAWVPWIGRTAVAVGPTGSDVSLDGGRTWKRFDTGSYDSVACTWDLSCWASGENGRAAVLTLTGTGP